MGNRPAVVAVYGGKGGIGKTTTAVTLAHMLGAEHGSTLLVDANADQPSAQLIYDTLTVDAPYDLTVEDNPALLGKVASVGYEFVLIDCPPSPSEAAAAIETADLRIVPYVPRWLETQAIMRTIRTALADGQRYRVLFTAVEHSMRTRARITREALSGFGVPMFDTQIRRYVAHEQAQSNGIPIDSTEAAQRFERADRAAADYRGVCDETLRLLKGAS